MADVTGEPAGSEMLGYARADQVADGIHNRLHARAFVLVDTASDRRLLLVVADVAMIFDSVHAEVLRRLGRSFSSAYTERNVMLTATHTHCGPGGYSHHLLYNLAGYRAQTFAAVVDGIVEAAQRAHADVAPARLTLARGELGDASVNRSLVSFRRNPAEERAFFPDAVDPQTTVLGIERDGQTVGIINWFATHATSMTNRTTLISGDNKGYASYHWERLVEGVDYHAERPSFVAAFAQSNAGDMSPNLNHAPGSGPTGDELANTRIIGERQYAAAARLAHQPGRPVAGGIDMRMTWLDLAGVSVGPDFTGDGRAHRTGRATAGAAAFAGTAEGPGFAGFRQGRGENPLWEAVSNRIVYRLWPAMREAQHPKAVALPATPIASSLLPLVQERVPVQLLRIGPLHLIAIPGEVTIVAGLRLRRAVAAIVGAEVADVIVAGYANGYIHYVTTPEEYDAQRYEGASTLFGRWELGAFIQAVSGLAVAMRDGVAVEPGPRPRDLSGRRRARARRRVDEVATGAAFGDVAAGPRDRYRPGERVLVRFVGAHPNNDLHRGGTFVEVQAATGGGGQPWGWRTVADDNDWSTTFRWSRAGRNRSQITVTWDIPRDMAPGRFRIRYRGDASDRHGRLAPFVAVTEPFAVQPG